MKQNGIIIPDSEYDVPESSSVHDEKITYFFDLGEAQKFCKTVGGALTVFTAPVSIEGELYTASVLYKI